MTPDEHYRLLGKLMAHLQSLEFILRAFLQGLPSARAIGIPYGTDIYTYPVDTELPESEITSYDSLRDLISKFNTEMERLEKPTVDATLVHLRDALAHGRVSSATPDDTMRLLKFGRPERARVRVVFNQQMTKPWFRDQIRCVRQAIMAVRKVMPP